MLVPRGKAGKRLNILKILKNHLNCQKLAPLCSTAAAAPPFPSVVKHLSDRSLETVATT